MSKKMLIISILLFTLVLQIKTLQPIHAIQNENLIYIIYDENGNKLFEKQNVIIGDEYISSNFEQYIVYEIDNISQTGKAKFVKKVTPPKIKKHTTNERNEKPQIKIGLYMTHNDESYLTGDGYDSIYGAGGIHDIAKLLKSNLETKGCNVILDETLHIPHDTKAYSRSETTAIKLLENNNVSFIYDIHRDGASRKTYVTKVNNEDFCKVRIVVGKANTNYEEVKNYALYIVSVSKDIHPMLFLDIYLANGNYNQYLTNYSLLFEMGSHLVEKELVEKTVPKLADVIAQTNKNLTQFELEEDEKIEDINPSPMLPPSNNSQNENEQNEDIFTNLNTSENNQISNKTQSNSSQITLLIYIVLTTISAISIAIFISLKKKK